MQVLVRISGELGIKSDRVRARFQRTLIKNIKAAMSAEGIEAKVNDRWSRIFVDVEGPEALPVFQRIFGIQSCAVIESQCESTLDKIVATGLETFGPMIEDGESFAVSSRRAGKQLPFTSMDVNIQLGSALNQGRDKVDLTNPDHVFKVEVRPETTLFLGKSVPCPGGLPIGTAGRALCLISGGYDSAVAAWQMQKRGVALDFVLCNMAGNAYERSVLNVTKTLTDNWSYGSKPRFHVINFEDLVREIKEKVGKRYAQVILKRIFYRAAECLAEYIGAEALITGEALAQVSSQTMQNLAAINDVAEYVVFRPLIGFNKEEIIKLARDIGTYAACEKIQEFCQLVPDKPVTSCTKQRAAEEESKVDLSLVAEAVESRKTLVLHSLTNADMVAEYITLDEIPTGAAVVDCRSQEVYDTWHYPDAVNIEYYKLLDSYNNLDRKQTYVIYCPVGMQSTLVAEKMQAEGYLAYSYRGGAKRLELSLKGE